MSTSLVIFDTLSGEKKPLIPLHHDVRLFVCGPTVYDDAHIGHARTYISFDVIARWIRHEGFFLRYIQNITDVDDKIIDKARDQKEQALVLARYYEDRYHEDSQAMRIDETDIEYARASDYMYQIINQVGRLIEKGNAYPTGDGSVYFSVASFPDYGKLSRQKTAEQQEGFRITLDQEKSDPADFVIWRGRYEADKWEPTWDAPSGKGRPGWHIEDTAIAEREFGPQYDLHGGARDLIFPHHEGEVAIMESLHDRPPMVNHWMHTGFLNLKGEKMSKSEGNTITVRNLLEKHRAESLRYFILQSHYRTPIDYNEDDLKAADQAIERLFETVRRLHKITTNEKGNFNVVFQTEVQTIINAMNDDFMTPTAMATIFTTLKRINSDIDSGSCDEANASAALGFLRWIDGLFSIIPTEQTMVEDVPPAVERLLEEREIARTNEDWKEADRIRQDVESLGYVIHDSEDGPELRKG